MQDTSLVHLGADDLRQPLVACQAEGVINMVFFPFTPAHQFFAAKAGVGAQDDLHLGPAPAQLGHDALHFFYRAGSRILVGRPQPSAQQLVAGEDIQRQIAVAVVVAVEEALRLMAVKRDIGGVQIEHDLARRRGVRLNEKIRQQPIQGLGGVSDLVIAGGLAGQFQPVQRALAGQSLIQIPLARQQGQQRIAA